MPKKLFSFSKALKFLAIFFVFTVGLDFAFRQWVKHQNPLVYYINCYYMNLLGRVNLMWIQEKKGDLLPPYEVFSNTNFRSEERLEHIFAETRKIKDIKIDSYDFLRNPEHQENTRYTAHFNNLGFRSKKNFNKEKQKNTRRILVYGSYHAFGLGVEDEQAYPARLEAVLNQGAGKIKYEVWNAGRPAGTAIIGLAQLKHDFKEYSPDLIIFDYGFVDALISEDHVFPIVLHFKKPFKDLLYPAIRSYNFLLTTSLIAANISEFFARNTKLNNAHNFFNTMLYALSFAKENNIPMVFVRQVPVMLPNSVYENVIEQIHFGSLFDAHVAFRKNTIRENEIQIGPEFWINEIDPDHRETLLNAGLFQFHKFRLDLWQINPTGHDIVANELSKEIRNKFK